MSAPYLDTSALAKWYLNEPHAEAFEAYITRQASAAISRLAVVEFRCLPARRRLYPRPRVECASERNEPARPQTEYFTF